LLNHHSSLKAVVDPSRAEVLGFAIPEIRPARLSHSNSWQGSSARFRELSLLFRIAFPVAMFQAPPLESKDHSVNSWLWLEKHFIL
jgi:hypothetical protein